MKVLGWTGQRGLASNGRIVTGILEWMSKEAVTEFWLGILLHSGPREADMEDRR
jgi:hypothetical protein